VNNFGSDHDSAMIEPESPTALVERWRLGDQEAARQLFERYSERLTAVAAKHLSDRLGSRVGGEDVIQSVFRTFFRRSADGEFRIDHSGELWRLLVKITIHKARSQARRHTAEQRNVNAEKSLDVSDEMMAAVVREPGPAEAVVLMDQIEVILAGLSETAGALLALRLEGYSRTEIAHRLNVSRQTVYRLLHQLQERLSRLDENTT
jgi:RNA polymerase sigma-70 factor (ECF subfamily)